MSHALQCANLRYHLMPTLSPLSVSYARMASENGLFDVRTTYCERSRLTTKYAECLPTRPRARTFHSV
eukprot:6207814-Pleurochrysis_carterae.AAC.1